MKFVIALLIASQAILLLNAQEFNFGEVVPGLRVSTSVNATQTATPGLINTLTRNFPADGIIHAVRATNIAVGSQVIAQIANGGPGHRDVTLIFTSPAAGQPIDFRVDVFAGVAMIQASMLFMTIALVISYLLK